MGSEVLNEVGTSCNAQHLKSFTSFSCDSHSHPVSYYNQNGKRFTENTENWCRERGPFAQAFWGLHISGLWMCLTLNSYFPFLFPIVVTTNTRIARLQRDFSEALISWFQDHRSLNSYVHLTPTPKYSAMHTLIPLTDLSCNR